MRAAYSRNGKVAMSSYSIGTYDRTRCGNYVFVVGKGICFKAIFINRLIWVPFDQRFSRLLTRFGDHTKLFELEMTLSSTQEALQVYQRIEESIGEGEGRKWSDPDPNDVRTKEEKALGK